MVKDFARQNQVNYVLLSDASGKAARAYGVLMPNGMASRVTFIIDRDGVIRHVELEGERPLPRQGPGSRPRPDHRAKDGLGVSEDATSVLAAVPDFAAECL